jgi:50S ribosomal protein L16 3-hydroxylase
MLKQIMGEKGLEAFLKTSYLKAPHSMPGEAMAMVPLLSWESFGALVARVPENDVLIVKNGRLYPEILPKTPAEVQKLHDQGFSLVLRNTERIDARLGAVARTLEAELKGKVAIQLYSTPKGHHSFGWHYDAEEVFILQAKGTKEYFVRENTVHPLPVLEAMPKNMEYEKESSATMATTLIPGDWLYIPGGWWHVAKATEDSLSLSVGVMPPTALDRLDALRAELVSRPLWRRRFAPGQATDLAQWERVLSALLKESTS